MSYGVVRVQKMTAGSVKGIEIHDRREKDHSNTNPDIDWSKTGRNYDVHPAQNSNFHQAVNERIKQLDLPKAVRKDAIVMAQVLVTSDSSFFDTLDFDISGDPQTRFFQDAYDFLAKRYGVENVISATVHLDERTPHMHFNFVPVTTDGRLSAKSIFTPASLTEQQTAFYQNVGQNYGLLRGEPKESGKRRTHLESAEYKAAMVEVAELRQEALESRQSVFESQEHISDLNDEETRLQSEISALQRDVEPYRKMRAAADEVNPEFSRLAPPGYVAIKKKDFEALQEQAKSYAVNRGEVDEVRKRMAAVTHREQRVNQREADIKKRSTEVDELGRRNADPLRLLQNAENERNAWKAKYADAVTKNAALAEENRRVVENHNAILGQFKALTRAFDDFKAKAAEEARKLTEGFQERLGRAYGYLTSVIKAVAMLKYNWADKSPNPYKVDGLNEKQGRLIDAIADYGAAHAGREGFPEQAKLMKNEMGLSEGIQGKIKELEPKAPSRDDWER